MKTKICTKCKTEYLAILKYFSPHRQGKDELQSWCRICHRGHEQKYRQTEKGKRHHKKRHKKYHATINGHLRDVFSGAKRRCNNPEYPQYKDYGGRGIKCLFKSSDEFVNYVINELQVDPRGLTIDRINNNGHYEKGNIRFVTVKVNNNNKKR